MNHPSSQNPTIVYRAHVVPFAVFMLVMAIPDALTWLGLSFDESQNFIFSNRQLWLYPIQTLACLGLLIHYARYYPWKPSNGIFIGSVASLIGIGLWLLPGFLFDQFRWEFPGSKALGLVDRSDGFNASECLSGHPMAAVFFWSTRLLRLLIVVPILEEVFWRSFLMRYLADPEKEFYEAEFGRPSTIGLLVVTGLFVVAHQPADYFGATCYGLLAYAVTVRTKSLPAVIIMHSVANGCLAVYAVSFGKWGYL